LKEFDSEISRGILAIYKRKRVPRNCKHSGLFTFDPKISKKGKRKL